MRPKRSSISLNPSVTLFPTAICLTTDIQIPQRWASIPIYLWTSWAALEGEKHPRSSHLRSLIPLLQRESHMWWYRYTNYSQPRWRQDTCWWFLTLFLFFHEVLNFWFEGVLPTLLSKLHEIGIITEDLAIPEGDDEENVYRGLCRLPEPGSRRRRIDFLTVPWTSRGAALLYYTVSAGWSNQCAIFWSRLQGDDIVCRSVVHVVCSNSLQIVQPSNEI